MTFILRYTGRVVLYNLTFCSRVKWNKETKIMDYDKTGREEEELGAHWENDDDESHLIVRLIHSNGSPWILGHYGSQEIFKSPLVVPITLKRDEKTVVILMRDYAARGNECIRRKFYLSFSSFVEAESFKFTHNLMLCQHLEG